MNWVTEHFYKISRRRKIKELENEINVLCERDEFNDKLYTKLSDELEELDPYNDMFHLGCKNWPNCETEGCGEGEGYLI